MNRQFLTGWPAQLWIDYCRNILAGTVPAPTNPAAAKRAASKD